MGYDHRIVGGLRIEPPLTYREYRDAMGSLELGLEILDLDPVEETTDTDTGHVIEITVPDVSISIAEGRMGGLRAELERIVDRFGGTHDFSGLIIREGHEQGDVERYWVERFNKGLVVKSEKATLRWPDGTEAP